MKLSDEAEEILETLWVYTEEEKENVELDAGQRGRIVYLHSKNDKELQKLMAMGILPGMPIQIIQKFPSYLLQIGQTQVAMDEEMAKDVYIRRGR